MIVKIQVLENNLSKPVAEWLLNCPSEAIGVKVYKLENNYWLDSNWVENKDLMNSSVIGNK